MAAVGARAREPSPAGVAAQSPNQEDNTAYGTTSAEFLLLGAGARGTALGSSFAAIATRRQRALLQPRRRRAAGPARAHASAPTITSPTPGTPGAASPSPSRAAAAPSASSSAPSASRTSRSTRRTSRTAPAGPTRSARPSSASPSPRTSPTGSRPASRPRASSTSWATVSGSAFAVDFGTNFHASLNDHPVKFSFVLANLGTNLTLHRDGAEPADISRDPIPGEEPVPRSPQPARAHAPRASRCPRPSGSGWRTTS